MVGTLVVILLAKEVLSLLVQLGQKFLSDRIRFRMAADLYDYTIQRIVSYHLSFLRWGRTRPGSSKNASTKASRA